ncbi:alpha/beta fold hydrolase [uncultured Devosia sp.]|uniref:alpha/beta fold hydrolase n=1 Tax=uncultured Devosia sp. TaxID=211434 RepID=UPI0035CBCBF8
MELRDDELVNFEAQGAVLPAGGEQGVVERDGARIWYAAYGQGVPVILLHGGLGHSGNFAHQVPALIDAGYRAVVIDSRGHGRSTRDDKPYSYGLMGDDVLAVMDALAIDKVPVVGWSDGACVGLVLAKENPGRISGVLFFACNVDPSGTRPFEFTLILGRCINRHRADYAALSATPDQFDAFSKAVGLMQRTQPDYAAADLESVTVSVTVVQSEFDEFITPEHAAYIARTIPQGSLVELAGVSHFAPLQRPALFNGAMLDFLAGLAR